MAHSQALNRVQEVLFLDPDDDLGSIRAKLESVSADEIYLVIPRRSSVLRAPLEFRILARLANDLASETIIVTSDSGRRAMAKHEGLRTRRSVGSVRGLTPSTGVGAYLPTVPEWIPLPSGSSIILLGLMIGLVGVLGLVVLPVMKVTIAPSTATVKKDLDIAVDPTYRVADASKGQLPGTLMQRRLEVTGSAPTSSTRQSGRDRARGEIVFTNRSPNEQNVPRGATVVARNGARFSIDSDVRIAPFSVGVARSGITAVNGGGNANVEANEINQIEGNFQGLTVANQRPTTGGSDREVKAVSSEDIGKLKEQLLKRAQDQFMQEFAAQAGPDRSVPPHTLRLRVENEIYDPPLEAEGDQVTARMMVAATVTSFSNSELNRLAQQMLIAAGPPGYDLPIDQLQLAPPMVMQAEDQRMQLRIPGEGLLVRSVDISGVAKALRGKSHRDATAYLGSSAELAGATSQVELTPSWAPVAFRIDVALAPLK
ncbi:MAG TPA: hypothetical protein VHX16_02410 [Chloroflexota bacterium]|nr:hypothetical protein [Chloroflexota bacterium]